MIKYRIKQSSEDYNSYNVIQVGRKNRWGEPYCVDVALTYDEAIRRCKELNETYK